MTTIIGVDPGFACLGLARVALLPGGGERVECLEVIRTEASARKREIRATDDNLRRAGELAAALDGWIGPDVVAICSESQSWPRNAATTAKVGMCWGVIAAVAHRHGLPVLQASPQEIKRAVAGRKTASKGEIMVALECRYDDLPPWPAQKGLVEHAADALAAVVACLDHPMFLMTRRMAGGAQ